MWDLGYLCFSSGSGKLGSMIEIQPRWKMKGNIPTASWLVFVNGKLAGTKSFNPRTRAKRVGLLLALVDCLKRLDPTTTGEVHVVLANKVLCRILFEGIRQGGDPAIDLVLDQHRDLLNSFVLVPSNKTGRVVA
jgi:hypothetical protein